MRAISKTAIALCCLAAVAIGRPALTEDTKAEMQLTRDEVQAKRTELLTEYLTLTTQESDQFWPVYRQYRADVGQLSDKTIQRVMNFTELVSEPTDKDAKDLVDGYLKDQKTRIDLQRKYLGKFEKILPPRKLVRYYQLENKMDAVVNLGLAGSVPLVSEKPAAAQ
jgi:hypothetical protein